VGLILLCGGLAGGLYCLYSCRTCLATLWVNRPKVYFAPREAEPARETVTKTEEYEMRTLPARRPEEAQPIYQRTRHIKNQVGKLQNYLKLGLLKPNHVPNFSWGCFIFTFFITF
jgi:hypothetical protein